MKPSLRVPFSNLSGSGSVSRFAHSYMVLRDFPVCSARSGTVIARGVMSLPSSLSTRPLGRSQCPCTSGVAPYEAAVVAGKCLAVRDLRSSTPENIGTVKGGPRARVVEPPQSCAHEGRCSVLLFFVCAVSAPTVGLGFPRAQTGSFQGALTVVPSVTVSYAVGSIGTLSNK